MPNYKNELTHEIITMAFERYSSTRKQTYVELQTLYKTLCQMVSDNSKSRKDRVFDRDIFEQMMEESILVKENNRVMVQMQSFKVNLMRTQIFINQTLKTLHSQSMNIIKQLSKNTHQPSNGERKALIRLNEIKQEKEQSQQSLFCLRLTFIKQENLKLLTQKMLADNSQLSYSIDQVLRRVAIEQNAQKNNQQIITTANKESYFKSIFILTFILITLQSLSMIFYSNFTLNILLFGMIMSMYVNKKYSKIMLKLLLTISILSIVMDLGFIYIHFRDIFNHNMSNMIEKSTVVRMNVFCGGYFVTGLTGIIFLTFFGKILLSIFIFMQLMQKTPNSKQLSLFKHQIQLRFIATLQSDTISQSLAKTFQQ